MNREVYRHLLQTYGKRPAVWFGFVAEFLRTALQRALTAIIVALLAASVADGNFDDARRYVILFLLTYVAGAIIGSIGDLFAVRSENLEYEHGILRYHKKLTGKDMSLYRDYQTGYLVSLFRQYLDSMLTLARLLRGDITRLVVSLLTPAVVLFVVDARLGLIVSAVIAVQIVYIIWSSAKANEYRKRTHEIYRKVTGAVSDHITNIVAFKSGGVAEQAHKQIGELARQEADAFWMRRKTVVLLDLPREIVTAVGITLTFLVVLTGAGDGNAGTVGLLVLTLIYMFQILRPISELPNLMMQHDDLVTKLHPTLYYLTSGHETVRDPKKPKRLTVKRGAIQIDGIGFSYPSHADNKRLIKVFDNLHINIQGGEQVGIVGLSGAGKSTLVSLLLRFDDVQSGAIKIDGTDVRDVLQDNLRRSIAYVPQEPLLFHETIRENIAYFSSRASEDTVVTAAKAAHAHEFIEKLPNGYDTVVGERGVKLSGGQKQRIVIARAILKNAPIVVFDEATSALDSESEKIIQQALPDILGRHTAVIIAHRLSTVANLDRILIMHDGEIVEEGTHDELLKLKGRYYALWRRQTSGEV
jgi:ATP-binding cassette subfamily B protein